jgi:hypothetical protein
MLNLVVPYRERTIVKDVLKNGVDTSSLTWKLQS